MYVSVPEIRAMAQGMTTSGVPPATDDLIRDMIERVSRLFDRECGVLDEYFESALHPVWESTHVYVVGDIITPTTSNSHKYRVTTAGTSGSTEPTFLTGSGSTTPASPVVGQPVFTEYGADVVATERTIYGDGTNYLNLPPYVPGTLDTVSLPEGYSAPDYVAKNGHLIRTYSNHHLPPGPFRSYFYGWDEGIPVTVTAKWGFATTPADVKLAIIEWVINVWRETDPAGLKLVNLDGMPLRERCPPRVLEVIKHRRMKGAAFV